MTTDAQILSALRTTTTGVTGTQLAERIGVSRATIATHIEELRTLGYDIHASPHFGYRLVAAPDALHADDLLARLGKTKVIGRDIRVFKETASTNDIVEKLARDGAPEGVVVFAEAQTKGRGRLGRKWSSPARKGLWFSVLLRPKLTPQETTQLIVASATALARAIRQATGVLPQIKWPNDILIRGRKVAGILTELTAELDRVKHVVLGVGVDVNIAAGDFPADLRKLATSLKIESGESLDRAELAAVILRELDRDYARITAGKFGDIANEWEAQCATLGSNVTIHLGDRTIRGQAEALDDDGTLLVRTQHGRLERIIGGDVILEK
jgi:BirA family biotin operon repressor/biotin-[acetyl-CoA-carboxylase] ligase